MLSEVVGDRWDSRREEFRLWIEARQENQLSIIIQAIINCEQNAPSQRLIEQNEDIRIKVSNYEKKWNLKAFPWK